MAKYNNLPTFTSHTTRTRGGVGFNSDTRNNSRMDEMGCTEGEIQLPGELRSYSNRFGDGQHFDFFAVVQTCAKCGKDRAVNIVSLCGDCAREELKTGTTDAAEAAALEELTALFLAVQDAADAEMFDKAERSYEETRLNF